MTNLKPFSNVAGIDLNGRNLSQLNLRGINLNGANLSNVNLGGANLQDSSLRGANLTRAFLCGANLADCNLEGANLSNADLRGADLRSANLSNTDLSNTALSGADIRYAEFKGSIGLISQNLQTLSSKDIISDKNSNLTTETSEKNIKWWLKLIILPIIIAMIGNEGIVSIIKIFQNQHHLSPPSERILPNKKSVRWKD